MRLKLLAAALAGAALTAPACALAATVIETAPIPTASVPYDYSFSMASFDTSLGTLQSVTFKLTDTSTGSVVVINTLGTDQAFTGASSSIPLTVTGGGLSITDTITAAVASGTVAAGTSASFAGSPVTDTVTNTFTTGLNAFEVNPTVNVSFHANAGAGTYGGTAAPGVAFTGSGVAGGTFEIIYNYAAVPEPATWAFLMLGVAAIGAVARSRRNAGLALTAA